MITFGDFEKRYGRGLSAPFDDGHMVPFGGIIENCRLEPDTLLSECVVLVEHKHRSLFGDWYTIGWDNIWPGVRCTREVCLGPIVVVFRNRGLHSYTLIYDEADAVLVRATKDGLNR